VTATKGAIRTQLDALVKKGNELLEKLAGKKDVVEFGADYQDWYTRTLPLVRTLAPDRFPEFRSYYEVDPKRKTMGPGSYVLQDHVNGMSPAPDWQGKVAYDHQQAALARMFNQVQILISLSSRIESVLTNVEGHLRADIEDRELSAAAELSKSNLRAAGTLAGVVLERHLWQVASNRGIKITKKDPTVGDLNEALKKETAYELPTYRKIQFLADIRNVCCHNKGREPTVDEVRELLSGVGGIIKSVF
jgi:hypothetical protein